MVINLLPKDLLKVDIQLITTLELSDTVNQMIEMEVQKRIANHINGRDTGIVDEDRDPIFYRAFFVCFFSEFLNRCSSRDKDPLPHQTFPKSFYRTYRLPMII